MIVDTMADLVDQLTAVRGTMAAAMTEAVRSRQYAAPHSAERATLRSAAIDIEDALVKIDRALQKVRSV